MSDRFIHVVYCDDIRNEVGNKQSWMGIYGAEYITERLPIVVPKLGVAITVGTSVEQPFQRLSFSIRKGDEALLEFFPAKEVLAQQQFLSQNNKDPSITRRSITFAVMISPLVVDAEATLQVFAETEVPGEILKGPRLRIYARSPKADVAAAPVKSRRAARKTS